MSMMLVMRPVTNPPPMVGHKNRGMCDVAHKVVQFSAVAEALVTTASKYINHYCRAVAELPEE